MSSRPSANAVVARRPAPLRSGARTRAKRDSDAFIVTVLTMAATIVACYDLLLLGAHVTG